MDMASFIRSYEEATEVNTWPTVLDGQLLLSICIAVVAAGAPRLSLADSGTSL